MAELKITIPDGKEQLVLEAFADARGIAPTPTAFKKEFVDEIRAVTKRYQLKVLSGTVQDVDVS